MSHPLVRRYKGGGTGFDIYRVKNGIQLELIGTIAGTLEAATNARNHLNGVAQLGDRIFALANGGLWQKDGAGAFVEKITAATLAGQDEHRTGFAFAMVAGVPTLFGVTQASNGNIYKYNYNTDTWTTTLSGVDTQTNFSSKTFDTVTVNGINYTLEENKMITLDPATDTVTVVSSGNESTGLTSYQDIIWVARFDTTIGNPQQIGTWVGGVFSLVTTLTGSQSPSNNNGKPLIYEVGGIIYFAGTAESGSDNGWVMGAWDGAVNTDVTNTILHPSVRAGGGLTGNNDRQWQGYCWKVMDGSTERVFIQIYLGTDGEGSVLFEHTGGVWVFINGSDMNSNLSKLSNYSAGGEFYWQPNELNAVPQSNATAEAGGMKIDFHANGDAGTADSVVELWYTLNGNGLYTQATIAAPSGGTGGSSVIAANVLTNVDADGDGGTPTTYSLLHNFAADGVPSDVGVEWFLRVRK